MAQKCLFSARSEAEKRNPASHGEQDTRSIWELQGGFIGFFPMRKIVGYALFSCRKRLGGLNGTQTRAKGLGWAEAQPTAQHISDVPPVGLEPTTL